MLSIDAACAYLFPVLLRGISNNLGWKGVTAALFVPHQDDDAFYLFLQKQFFLHDW